MNAYKCRICRKNWAFPYNECYPCVEREKEENRRRREHLKIGEYVPKEEAGQ